MVDLTLYVLFHRLMNWGLAPLIAARTVAADAAAVSDLLSDPANQLRLPSIARNVKRAAARLR